MTVPKYPGETPDGAFRAEIVQKGDTSWAGNALRFGTIEHAREYARGLWERWTGADKYRAVPVSTPERQPYTEGSEDGPGKR